MVVPEDLQSTSAACAKAMTSKDVLYIPNFVTVSWLNEENPSMSALSDLELRNRKKNI